MSMEDALGGAGGALGGIYGAWKTMPEQEAIFKRLMEQYQDAQGLDTSQLGKTSFDGISTDPKTREAQMQALSRLQEISNSNGLDAQSRAMNAESQREAAGYESSQRAALQNSLQARGLGNSGAAVSGLLAGQQGGANRASQASMEASAQAQKRQMGALQGSAELGGSIRAQDYGQARDKASAEDSARQHAFQAALAKLSAVGGARHDWNAADAATRAAAMGQYQAVGQGIGSTAGGAVDTWANAETGGAAGGKGKGGGSPIQSGEGAGSGYSQQSGIPWSSGNTDLTDEERQKRGMDMFSSFGNWGG